MKSKILEVILTILKKLLPSKWVLFIDGYKSIIGIIGFTICLLLPLFGINLDSDTINAIQILFGALGIYGITDKLEKGKKSTEDLKEVIQSIKNESK